MADQSYDESRIETPFKQIEPSDAVALAGSDELVDPDGSLTVLSAIKQCWNEADLAKRTRVAKSRENINIYNGKQDWSHKLAGQSAEFLPMVPMAVEQIASFVKKALVSYGQWFSSDVSMNPLLTSNEVSDIILSQLNTLQRVDQNASDFPTLISDAIKIGLLQSLLIFKVYWKEYTTRKLSIEQGTRMVSVPMSQGESVSIPLPKYSIKEKEKTYGHLCVDLVNPEDYYPDPTGRGLYKIHRVYRDLYEIIALSEGDDPIYDPEVVEQLKSEYVAREKENVEANKANQDPTTPPEFRKPIVLDEFWGTLLNEDGKVVYKNCVATRANDKYLLRKPTENPMWHQEDPFVAAPLIRVPFSVWHKAIMDHAVPLGIAASELFSLMLDGAFEAVHGIKQLRSDYCEHPEDLSGGIAPGTTIPIKAETPMGMKVLERVDQGAVPPEALQMFGILDRQFQAATSVSDTMRSVLPDREVKATALVQASQGSSNFFDGIVRDLEDKLIEPLLWKSWYTMLQFMDNMATRDVQTDAGRAALLKLQQLSAKERYAVLANSVSFSVRGLSGTMDRARDLQKMLAVLQVVAQNPVLMQSFFKKYDVNKLIEMLFKWINLNPSMMELSPQDQANSEQRMGELERFAQITGGARGSQSRAEAGGASQEAAINQTSNPLTGISGGEA